MPSIEDALTQIRQENLPPIEDALNEIRQTDKPDIPEGPRGGAGGEYEKEIGPFAFLETDKQLVRGVGGGLLDLTEAIATLPTDIVATLGSKRFEKISENIRQVMPNIKPESTFEEVVNVFTQYGIPSGTALKITKGLTKAAPWAIRAATDLTAGAVADFVAADPSESTAIPWGPTAKVEGEKPSTTRLKIGAEGAIVPAALAGPIGLATGIGKWVGTRIFPTKGMIERALSATLHEHIGAKRVDRAIRNIQEGMKKQAADTTEFKATTGTLSEDPTLLAYEKGVVAQQRFAQSAAEMQERKAHNLNTLNAELEKVTKQYGGDPERAKQFFFTYFENLMEGKTNALEATKLQFDNIKLDTQDMLHTEAKLADRVTPSSIILNDQINSSLDALTRKKSELYRNIDPDRTVPVSLERVKKAWSNVKKSIGEGDITYSQISNDLKEQMEGLVKLKEGDLTYFDLENNIRPVLSPAIGDARAGNQGNVVERLVEFKKALQQESVYLELAGAEAGRRASIANNFYRNEYVPRFKAFVGDNYRKAIRKGQPIAPSMVGQKFLYQRNATVETTEQLQSIIKKADNPVEANMAAREYLVGVFAEQLRGATSTKHAKATIDRFLNQRHTRETLVNFPQVRKELHDFQTSIGTKLETETKFGKLVAAANQDLKLTEKQINQNAAKWWVSDDPLKAMKRVLDSGDPERYMKQLVDLAKKDESGSALKGLRTALDNLIEQPVSAGGVRGAEEILHSGGKYEMKLAKIRHLLEYKPIRKAISQLYSPQEMKTLDAMHDKLRLMERINLKVTASSPTAILEESVRSGQVLAFSLFGIVKGRGMFMISRKVQQILGRDPVELAWRLLRDSMLDPELAQTLLMKATKNNMPKIKADLTRHMINNLMTTED